MFPGKGEFQHTNQALGAALNRFPWSRSSMETSSPNMLLPYIGSSHVKTTELEEWAVTTHSSIGQRSLSGNLMETSAFATKNVSCQIVWCFLESLVQGPVIQGFTWLGSYRGRSSKFNCNFQTIISSSSVNSGICHLREFADQVKLNRSPWIITKDTG